MDRERAVAALELGNRHISPTTTVAIMKMKNSSHYNRSGYNRVDPQSPGAGLFCVV